MSRVRHSLACLDRLENGALEAKIEILGRLVGLHLDQVLVDI